MPRMRVPDALLEAEDQQIECRSCSSVSEEGSQYCRSCGSYWKDVSEGLFNIEEGETEVRK